MRFEKRKNNFPPEAVAAVISRMVGRQRKFLANSRDQKHHHRPARTWSYACTTALNKLRYRHENIFRESRPPDLQAFTAGLKKRKLARKTEPLTAWADAEYRILERYHGRMARDPRPERFEAAAWAYVVDLQRWKIRRLEKTPRRRGGQRKADWPTVIRNALHFRLHSAYRPVKFHSATGALKGAKLMIRFSDATKAPIFNSSPRCKKLPS